MNIYPIKGTSTYTYTCMDAIKLEAYPDGYLQSYHVLLICECHHQQTIVH